MNKPIMISVAALALFASACGEATDANTAPNPEDVGEVLEIERDLPEPEEAAPAIGEINSTCSAQLAEPYAGETLDLATRTALLDAVAPQVLVRFLGPEETIEGDDSNPNRLNIRTDDVNVISEVFCG